MRVVVTGAHRGIGLELVRQLLARGDTVDAACRRPAEASELRAIGARVHGVDLASAASVAAFAQGLDGVEIDWVINNAGEPGDPQRPDELGYEAAMRTFETLALGAARISQAFAPHLRRGNGKKLAHVSASVASIGATRPGDLAYRMSRTALHMIAKSIAAELHADQIVSIVVHPWARTEAGAPIGAAEAARAVLLRIDAASFVDSGAFIDLGAER
jgi:NAD(P)-dependent dehydrogenase (short-subunit alcohol dehydrogenase family)